MIPKAMKPIILLADDNEIINKSHKKILLDIFSQVNLDYDVVEIFDGYDVIKFALNLDKDYDKLKLIITDENMSYLNGSKAIEFLREYEKKKNYPKIKTISSTSYDDISTTHNLIKIGFDIVIFKPIYKNNLISALMDLNLI